MRTRLLTTLLLAWCTLAATTQAQEQPRLERTVTERPLELSVDRRQCGRDGIHVQVLGAGGPELDDGQGGPGYLVWVDGKARVLIDAGPGTALRFEESGADFSDLHAIVFSQVSAQHSTDLPALVLGATHAGRSEDLPIIGPAGNDRAPGFNDWIGRIIGPEGAYPELSSFLTRLSEGGFQLEAGQIDPLSRTPWTGHYANDIRLNAIGTDHGNRPALAWRVDVGDHSITFAGSTANQRQRLGKFAEDSVMLIAHHAIPEHARGVARERFMTPSAIGRLADRIDTNRVVLSHRSARTRGRETESRDLVREHFGGSVVLANDLDCWQI